MEGPVLKSGAELHKIVYNVLLTQIQFGAYRRGEKLPTIEEAGAQLGVSVDTARAAYLELKEKGYITLSKNVGATVKADYSAAETENFIQTFFSQRKSAMADLADAMLPLFGNAQWVGLRHAGGQTLRAMEELLDREAAAAPYAMLEHLDQKYSALGNPLLTRLAWQAFMFLHAPFFSIPENLRYFDRSADYLPQVLSLCRAKDWPALRAALDRSVGQLSPALSRFYGARITRPACDEVSFTWSSYKKSGQLRYSLAMELLISISRGVYPAGGLLPPQQELAAQKGVSVSTVRRALELLHSVGAIKSARYVGTWVLPFEQATENSDFTRPVLQRRLLDMAESLQILALSCKEVSLLTLSSLSRGAAEDLCGALQAHRRWRRGEVLSYFILDRIAENAPRQAIRTVYAELLRQFFWGYALRGLKGSQADINALYDPYFDELTGALRAGDFPRFAAVLESLVLYELRWTVRLLSRLGVPGAETILLPDDEAPDAPL